MYFKKILVANRGEIAVRVIRACHELGIVAVAVYSAADRSAMHVRLADEAIAIGPTPATKSYLNIAALVDAAQFCGAEAVHPGYGFLSEQARFARACSAAGLVFIGPPANAIDHMGSKLEAKRLAIALQVPVIPGYVGADQQPALLTAEAQRTGYPLLIKASAGGGGKGMRLVERAEDFGDALAAAQREAQAAFGSADVLLERVIRRPRHVEIQVLADHYGACVYLGERECSIQRRHQKIVEEAPSPALQPALRERMGEAALRVARAVGYTNAGTVEFMLDDEDNFYFLEMNTRLQVEHAVTEAVFGHDLVRWQIAIAAGAPLPFDQSALLPRGHALEVRIYAEDPVTLLPAVGRIVVFDPPMDPGLRHDAGVASGDEVTTAYDPMLAKLIAYGEDRPAAVRRMQQALREYTVLGVTTNIPLLQAIVGHPAFAAGETFTDFLTVNAIGAVLADRQAILPEVLVLAAVWQVAFVRGGADPWDGPWRLGGSERRVRLGSDIEHDVVVRPDGEGWQAVIGAVAYRVSGVARRSTLLVATINGSQVRAHVSAQQGALLLGYGGVSYRLELVQGLAVDDLVQQARPAADHGILVSPMPGTIISVLVEVGQHVEARQPLLILEAMKMEQTVVAPHAGTVLALPFAVGQSVGAGVVLVDLDAAMATPEGQ